MATDLDIPGPDPTCSAEGVAPRTTSPEAVELLGWVDPGRQLRIDRLVRDGQRLGLRGDRLRWLSSRGDRPGVRH